MLRLLIQNTESSRSWTKAQSLVLFKAFWSKYRICLNAAPGFYFLFWVFGWGSIQIWLTWGSIRAGVVFLDQEFWNPRIQIVIYMRLRLCQGWGLKEYDYLAWGVLFNSRSTVVWNNELDLWIVQAIWLVPWSKIPQNRPEFIEI